MTKWKPEYRDRYYTVEYDDTIKDYKIKYYIWLDLDDDEEAYRQNNVYRTLEAATAAARRRPLLDVCC